MKTEFNTYQKLLKNGALSKSTVPKSVLNSQYYKSLCNARILKEEKVGRGYKIIVNKEKDFERALDTRYPETTKMNSRSSNVKAFRNSKATSTSTFPVFLFRGFCNAEINNSEVDMAEYTDKYRIFAASPFQVKCQKICFIENLGTFFRGEEIFDSEYLLIHKYGRIGRNSVSIFESNEALVFGDYDFTGLDEYLRIKSELHNARLYIPDNYEELYQKYSISLKGNKTKMSTAVKNSSDPHVVRIREQVAKENRFLEQEALLND